MPREVFGIGAGDRAGKGAQEENGKGFAPGPWGPGKQEQPKGVKGNQKVRCQGLSTQFPGHVSH